MSEPQTRGGATWDGTTLTVSQSWINDFINCPENARRQLHQRVESPTPEAELGTLLHEVIATRLNTGRTDRSTLDDAEHRVRPLIAPQSDRPHPWESVNLVDLAHDCFTAWERFLLMPLLRQKVMQVETEYSRLLIETPIPVVLRGTVDCLTSTSLWDWKLSSRDWRPWEIQRYNLQSTAYSYLVLGDQLLNAEFTFGVISPNKIIAGKPDPTQIITIYRGPGDVDWLRRIAAGIARIIQRCGIDDEWPPTGHTWLCAPKWCAYWDECRGQHGHRF